MKAVVFAGGQARRLATLAKGFNKNLLPIGNTAVIERGLAALSAGGITELLVITNSGWQEAFTFLFRERSNYDLSHIEVIASERPDLPLADVLYEAKPFTGSEDFLLLFGDNVFFDSFAKIVVSLTTANCPSRVVLAYAPDPERFGLPILVNSRLVRVVEKPPHPWTHLAVTGLARFPREVYRIIESLPRDKEGSSDRYLTGVRNGLASRGELTYYICHDRWLDIGTPSAFIQALLYIC